MVKISKNYSIFLRVSEKYRARDELIMKVPNKEGNYEYAI